MQRHGISIRAGRDRLEWFAWSSPITMPVAHASLVGEERGLHYGIRKFTLLVSVPPDVTTWTLPVVAPEGTVVVISDFEATVKVAVVPLNVTLVAPVRLVPRILTAAPTLPAVGTVSTNGTRSIERRNIVPLLLLEPAWVVVP